MKGIFSSSNLLLACGVLMAAVAISVSAAELKASRDAFLRQRNATAASGTTATIGAWDLAKPCWSSPRGCVGADASDQSLRLSRKK